MIKGTEFGCQTVTNQQVTHIQLRRTTGRHGYHLVTYCLFRLSQSDAKQKPITNWLATFPVLLVLHVFTLGCDWFAWMFSLFRWSTVITFVLVSMGSDELFYSGKSNCKKFSQSQTPQKDIHALSKNFNESANLNFKKK